MWYAANHPANYNYVASIKAYAPNLLIFKYKKKDIYFIFYNSY